jgi:hypothetical protein
MNTPGDANLDALSGYPTFDAAVLEFDFVPTANQVTFTYAFGSDEYPEWVNTVFNDVFAFFVNGENCATERKVAGDPASPFVPVAINNINNGNPVGDPTTSRPDLFKPNYFNPTGPSALDLELDGITTDLICQHAVNPGVTNHMKLAVADASDQVWDSAVFIQAGSLVSNENPTADLGLVPSSGAAPLDVTATIEGNDPNNLPLTYSLDWGDGTAPATGSLPGETTLEHHTYNNGGTFLAKLTISNGTLTGVDTEDVDVSGGSTAAPVVTQQPSNQTVADGDTFEFSAFASGNPAPTIQWQVSTDGGANFTDIPGAVFSSYSDTATLSDDGNLYQAVFTNDEASVTSDPALLTVTTAPESAPVVTVDPEDQSVFVGDNFSFTAAADGTPAPTVQWQVSTDGGDVFTDIPSATDPTYSGVAALSDNGNQYRAVFTNSSGSATSGDALLTVASAAEAPTVTLDPADLTVVDGAKFSFSAAATGNPVPDVQWQLSTDGGASFGDIPGATETSFGGAATVPMTGNQYRAVFTNSAGSATSAAATLTVQDVTAPSLSVWLTPASPFLRHQTGITVNHSESDDSGHVTVVCGTVDTATAGSRSVSCTATDPTGNATTVSESYTVGFQVTASSPTSGASFRRGAKISVTFQLRDALGLLTDSQARAMRSSLTVSLDGGGSDTPGYQSSRNEFTSSLATRGVTLGAHTVTIRVLAGTTVVNEITIPVTITA